MPPSCRPPPAKTANLAITGPAWTHGVESEPLVRALAGSRFSIVLVPRFRISTVSWRDAALTLLPFALLLSVILWVTLRFVNPAPPTTIVMTSGADGSMFQVNAARYAKILAKQGVTLKILPSQGSLENLKRLSEGVTLKILPSQGSLENLKRLSDPGFTVD